MLVLTRKKDQEIVITLGKETVRVRVLEIARDRCRLGVSAPRSIVVHREEVAQRIREWEEQEAAMLAANQQAPANPAT